MFRFRRITVTLVGIGALSALSVIPATTANASGSDIKILSTTSYQYYLYCNENQTPPPCNLQGSLELGFDVWNADGGPASTIGYTVINGSAVDGTDFNIPATGTINVPAGGGTGALIVPVINEGAPDATETFTVKLANGATATGTIYSQAEVPSDCSLSAPSNTAIAMTCTNRPAGQTWYDWGWCIGFKLVLKYGTQVTGDGTSTLNCGAYPPLGGVVYFSAPS